MSFRISNIIIGTTAGMSAYTIIVYPTTAASIDQKPTVEMPIKNLCLAEKTPKKIRRSP